MARNNNRRNNFANNGNNQPQNDRLQNYQHPFNINHGNNQPQNVHNPFINNNPFPNNNGNQAQDNNRRNNRNNTNHQQNNGQLSHFNPNRGRPPYQGRTSFNRNGNQNNDNNGSSNDQASQQRQKQNGKSSNVPRFADPQQQALHESWQKRQDDQKRKMEQEASELLQKEQRDFLASQYTPSTDTILAFQTLVSLFRMQMARDLSASEATDKMQAFQTLQSHFIQQPHPEKTTQPLLSTLAVYVVSCATAIITDSVFVDRLWKTLEDLQTKLAMSISQSSDGEFESLLRVQNDAESPKMPALPKHPQPVKQQYQTNVHVDDLLNRFDSWLKENGITAVKVTNDSVYYHSATAATEPERRKEVRFIDISDRTGYVRLEGNDHMIADAAMLRAAEHAYIVWTAERQAAEAVSRIKEANKSVLHNVARVHPEARKQLETFEKGLQAERAQIQYREMQAQLDFERQQKELLQKLEERLEQQRREFLGIDADEVKPRERFYIPATASSSIPADFNFGSRPNYASPLFSGLKTSVKPVDPTVPLAAKKQKHEKKKPFYPRFLHGSSLFKVEKYGGDPSVAGHLERDQEGEFIQIRPMRAPCVPGCRDCLKYEQPDVV